MARWILIGVAVASTGCGLFGKGAAKPDAAKAPAGGASLAEGIRTEKRGNEKVTEYDLNHDGKPDVWSYTVPGKTPEGQDIERLVRKELDINWDGKVDITRTYDEHEQIEKE